MQVISKDGTPIAYEKKGTGPSLILVDGAFCNKTFGPMPALAALLSPNFTVYLYDRRGRGESGDIKPYAVEKEIEDMAALIQIAGGSAHVFGISSGAILSLQAVRKGLNVTRLAIFEPPYVGNENGKRPATASEQLSSLVEENRMGDAVKFFLTKVMGAPAVIAFILKLTPNWAKMKANAAALPYDLAICGNFEVPESELASITIPVLAIDSLKSHDLLRKSVEKVANALPGGKRKSLSGSPHNVPPKILAPVLTDFFK